MYSAKCCTSFGNAGIDFIINVHNSWQCTAMVGELVYHLQSLTFHCDGGLLVRLSRCWMIYHLSLFDADCEVIAVTWIRYLIHTFCIFSSVGAPFVMSSTSVCTFDLACNHLSLRSFPSKQYLIGISWKASMSLAENIMLYRVGASTQPSLKPFGTGNGSENEVFYGETYFNK